ncbi:MAG: beta-N-acetylhexosaminidase [Candidatus Promineifilaceae bacterium]|jgi:hexosaminidase
MNAIPLLLPKPRYLIQDKGVLELVNGRLIVLDGTNAPALRLSAILLQQALAKAGVSWAITAGALLPPERIGVTMDVTPGSVRHIQGYELTITPRAIHLVAQTPAAIFYAVSTLIQLLDQYPKTLPAMRILDWPDFPNRGVMLDISRDKVPTMETLHGLVDMFASWKINQLQLYTEHTFAYQKHPLVWADASPLTGADILALDAYCRERFIELVPNQNTFGHMRRWLVHDRYRHLAECPQGCDTVWGHFDEPFSLCPGDPGSLQLVRDMLDELLPHFQSRQVNVGCDETVDVGQGRSREAVAEKGAGRVYFDFLNQIRREVRIRERTMQFWGDIVIEHPDLVAELPRDIIALEWGYEANHAFHEHGDVFARSGIPFYVCPGTSSWNTVGGRTGNAINNMRNAAENGLNHGATGFLTTDWGDNGHWQPLPVSYLGFAYGAALSWHYESNRDLDIAAAGSRYTFRDSAEVMGRLAYDLGNVYEASDIRVPNGTVLFYVLQIRPNEMDKLRKDVLAGDLSDRENYTRMRARIDQVMAPLGEAQMKRPDAELLYDEFTWTADMLRHACDRALWLLDGAPTPEENLAAQAQELIDRFQTIWMARNRSGGFRESVARMEAMRADYL